MTIHPCPSSTDSTCIGSTPHFLLSQWSPRAHRPAVAIQMEARPRTPALELMPIQPFQTRHRPLQTPIPANRMRPTRALKIRAESFPSVAAMGRRVMSTSPTWHKGLPFAETFPLPATIFRIAAIRKNAPLPTSASVASVEHIAAKTTRARQANASCNRSTMRAVETINPYRES